MKSYHIFLRHDKKNNAVTLFFVSCICGMLWQTSLAAPANPTAVNKAIPTEDKLFSEFNPKTLLSGKSVRFLGFASSDTAVFVVLNEKGSVIQWKVKARKIATNVRLPLNKWIGTYDLTLSSNGKWLIANNNRSTLEFPHVKVYRTTIFRSSDFKAMQVKSLSEREDSTGILALSTDEQHVVIKMNSLIPYENTFTFGRDRLVWLNVKTGKMDKSLPYSPAVELDKLIVSPSKSYFAGLFYGEAFNPYGESDYAPLKNTLEREGFVDIISPTTGKILWHVESSYKRPIGDPFFFISPTQFVSSDTLFDIPTKTAKPWSAVSATRKCLAVVPNHASYALFVTPQGLELRDWRRKRTLCRWPTITKSGHILFSPDLKMFSFKRDSTVQFWKFDPAWLK